MQLALNPGQVDVMIGSSSSDIRLTGTFTICGQSPLVIQKKVFFSEVTES
jgi:beta-glucosidase